MAAHVREGKSTKLRLLELDLMHETSSTTVSYEFQWGIGRLGALDAGARRRGVQIERHWHAGHGGE